MLSPGPVFDAELRAASRRQRDYIVRLVYGVGLLVVVVGGLHKATTPQEEAAAARSVFQGLAILQVVAVLVLTPAVVAGAIAEERRRGTLIDLLISSLSAAEIILGKLAARFVRIIAVLAIGLPVLALLTLLGGVGPVEVVLSFAIATGAALVPGGLSILVSTIARRPRDAIVAAYLLESLWVVPRWAIADDPLTVLNAIAGGSPPVGDTFASLITRFLLVQGIAGAVGVAAAIGLLRRTARNAEARPGRRRWALGRSRPRPAIGDDPMTWKERYANRHGGWVRGLIVLAGLVAVVGAGFEAIRLAIPAFGEVYVQGYGGDGPSAHAREELNVFIRQTGALLYGLWALGIAATAAVGVAEEREAGTWSSLLVTDLGGEEILGAKARGAVHSMRGLGIALVSLWTLGLAAGAIHPFGFVLVIVGFNAFGRATASLGTYFSLKAATTTRALVWTLALLGAANLGNLLCCGTMPGGLVGCTPLQIGLMPLSYGDVAALLGRNPADSIFGRDHGGDFVLSFLLAIGIHAFLAVALDVSAVAFFDEAAGRPRRSSGIPIDL